MKHTAPSHLSKREIYALAMAPSPQDPLPQPGQSLMDHTQDRDVSGTMPPPPPPIQTSALQQQEVTTHEQVAAAPLAQTTNPHSEQ